MKTAFFLLSLCVIFFSYKTNKDSEDPSNKSSGTIRSKNLSQNPDLISSDLNESKLHLQMANLQQENTLAIKENSTYALEIPVKISRIRYKESAPQKDKTPVAVFNLPRDPTGCESEIPFSFLINAIDGNSKFQYSVDGEFKFKLPRMIGHTKPKMYEGLVFMK